MSFIVTWILLAGFWFGLSGFTDPIHLTFGAISVTLVAAFSHKLLLGDQGIGTALRHTVRTALYVPWLLWQVAVANIDVALRVLSVRGIEPRMIRFKPDLHTEYGRTLYANSITLTPGTVTVDVSEDGEFIVHALTPEAAEAVLSRDMERRVKKIEGGS